MDLPEHVERDNKQQPNIKEIQEILLYFSSSIFGQNSVEDIVWDLAKNCINKLQFVDCVIYLIDENTGKLVQKAAYGPKNPKDFQLYKPIELTVGVGIVGGVAQSGISQIINDTTQDSRYIVDDELRYSEISVPIMHQGTVIGVIDSEHPEKDFFNEQHEMVLSIIASICANKIINTRLQERYFEKQSDLLKIEKKISELKFAQLRSQLNPHFIFNSLNAIQYFIVTNRNELSLRYLSKFSKIIRYTLENVHTEALTLEEEIQMLMGYLELESIRFGDKFTYVVKPVSGLSKGSIKIPFLLIQPFVEEAIEKRILGSGSRGHLTIEFSQFEDYLHCTISDTGISTQRVLHLNKVKNLNLEPSGVEIAIQRINDLNRYSSQQITIVSRDLKGSSGENKGTEVVLSIPLIKE